MNPIKPSATQQTLIKKDNNNPESLKKIEKYINES